ncbi:helicase [Rhodococcus wratislaviensis IFP 2016]|nr:helicase [Rhodococcus wratislaviensis IFP 2016]
MINRLMVTSASVDGDLGAFGKLARLFDADWLSESMFE